MKYNSLSEKVREVLRKTPDLTPTMVVERLATKGIHVAPNLVSNVKSNMKKAGLLGKEKAQMEPEKWGGFKKLEIPSVPPTTMPVMNGTPNTPEVAELAMLIMDVKRLAERCGGMDQLYDVIHALKTK